MVNYYVSIGYSGGWAVRKWLALRSSRVFKFKKDAVEWAIEHTKVKDRVMVQHGHWYYTYKKGKKNK